MNFILPSPNSLPDLSEKARRSFDQRPPLVDSCTKDASYHISRKYCELILVGIFFERTLSWYVNVISLCFGKLG